MAPGQVVDVLALMGDSSDNIPGVPRVGEVTAKKWITEYGSLDQLLARAEEVKGKVGESLREHTEDALLSRRLAAIQTDLPIPFDPEALKRSAPDPEKLKELFVELEFHSLAAEIQGEVAQAALSSNRLEQAKGVRRRAREIGAGVALLTRDGQALLAAAAGSNVAIAEGPAAEIRERWIGPRALGREARDRRTPSPSTASSRRPAAAPRSELFDVGPGAVRALARRRQLAISSRWCSSASAARSPPTRTPASSTACSPRRTRSSRPTAGSPSAPRAPRTWLRLLSAELAARPELEKVYREIERPLTPVLARMELAGIAIDAPLLNEMSGRMEKDLRALEQKIWEEAGEEFNVNSPVQLGTILFEKLGLQSGRKTAKTKSFSTGVEVLDGARRRRATRCPSACSSTARSRS